MSSPVKLYVYDLSNGMARQLSQQLTGRQIDGIWHTSVVVFGKEIFYGQGINTTLPGRSHHGAPLQVIDMGETALDEETFNEYLAEMREHYTADKYHLLDFNCNSFTNDCVGFLTGGSIPDFIIELPTDFLSTPFGAALRPTIDSMYRRPSPGAPPALPPTAPAAAAAPNPQLAASILQAVAAQAQSAGDAPNFHPSPATQTLAAPLHAITNSASFRSFLGTHRAAVAFFTSATCGPCRMIEPVFERLAEEKGVREQRDGAGFAKVDIEVGGGRGLAAEWSVRATPTFMFFLDGKKINEVKGADVNELRTQVDLLLFQAYPPHPHTSLSLPAIQALSLNPILFSQVPAIDTVFSKLSSFIDAAPWPNSVPQAPEQVKQSFTSTVAPYLKARFAVPIANGTAASKSQLPSASPAVLTTWAQATSTLVSALPMESLFPLVDMWRLAFLDPAVGTWSSASPASDPISTFLPLATTALQTPTKASRNYVLTVLRLLANAFSSVVLAHRLLAGAVRDELTGVLVPSLLHEDAAVRTAAASLAFNAAAVLQKGRVDAVRTGRSVKAEDEAAQQDWEVEMVSAVVEAIDREKENEEVVHRLTASLAFLLRVSPFFDADLKPLLEVLQSRQVLRGKLKKGEGWKADGGIGKKEIRKLVEEVAGKLCP